jgi:hydrogenase nickel incorporation protein HypB
VNPGLQVIRTSATSGEGMDEWLGWIETGVTNAGQAKAAPAAKAAAVSYRPVA